MRKWAEKLKKTTLFNWRKTEYTVDFVLEKNEINKWSSLRDADGLDQAKHQILAAEWPGLLLHPPRKWRAREGKLYQ